MIRKIISGGQTGVDRAALDAAIKLGIAHGGWIPKGRLAEDGSLPMTYNLQETDGSDYAERTAKNIHEADGTLIVSRGALSGGSALTRQLAIQRERPWLHIDLDDHTAFRAAVAISKWLSENRIEVLNVAGPRASKDPQIYAKTRNLLKSVVYLTLVHENLPNGERKLPAGQMQTNELSALPATIDEAVERLIADMALKDRVTLANMAEVELAGLETTLGGYILNRFDLDGGNTSLLEACRRSAKSAALSPSAAAGLIIREVWRYLRGTHKLRIV